MQCWISWCYFSVFMAELWKLCDIPCVKGFVELDFKRYNLQCSTHNCQDLIRVRCLLEWSPPPVLHLYARERVPVVADVGKTLQSPSFSGLLLFHFNYIQPRPQFFLQGSVWINLSPRLDTKDCIWGPLKTSGENFIDCAFSPTFWLLITFFSFFLAPLFTVFSLVELTSSRKHLKTFP